MRALLLPLALAGCSGGSAPPPVELRPFDARTGAEVLHLDSLPARYELPRSSMPGGAPSGTTFRIPRLRRVGAQRFEADAPFHADITARRFAPPGMGVTADGREIPYSTEARRPGGSLGWFLSDGRLHLAWDRDEPPDEVVIEHPRLAEELARMQLGESGLEATEFVRHHVTWSGVTRPGLLLPAPGVAEWALTLPEGAWFEAFPTIAPHPLTDARSDGAEISLSIVAGGVERRLDTRVLQPGSERFERWRIDLSAHGGREVTLRATSGPRGSADHDYVFLGAPTVSGRPQSQPRRVVVVGLDTLRPDHLGLHGYGRDTSPRLDRWAAGAAVFDAAWAPAPRTRPSFRSATTGRRPLDAVGATNIGRVFRDAGFATAGIVANLHLHPRFDFDEGFDLWWLDPAAKADQQVERALAWLEENRDRDTYLFLHVMDPHLYYEAPEPFGSRFLTDPDPSLPERFNRLEALRWEGQGQLTEQRKQTVRDRYDGEIAWTDHQLGRFLDGLATFGENTLVVIHTDHGEELWEHGGFEHNHSLYDEVVRAALVVRPPGGLGGPLRVREPTTLHDIAPTLYDWAGIDSPPPSDGRSLRGLVEGSDPGGWDRALPVGYQMFGAERWGVVWRDHKYILHTGSGAEELYDLGADPAEQADLSSLADLAPFRAALAEAHAMAVGPGWRIELGSESGRPLELELPAAAMTAGVVDPEALRESRANQAWGELAPRLPEAVATVSLSGDRRTLRIEPGPEADGLIWVLFEAPVPVADAVLRVGGERASPAPADDGRLEWREGSDRASLWGGTVVVAPAGEAARMRAAGRWPAAEGRGEADPEHPARGELDLLERLGYVGGGE